MASCSRKPALLRGGIDVGCARPHRRSVAALRAYRPVYMTISAELREQLTTPGRRASLQFPRELREQLERDCGFTDDEVEILRLRGRGWSYKQIADECHVCEETVRNRIRRIKNKIATLI